MSRSTSKRRYQVLAISALVVGILALLFARVSGAPVELALIAVTIALIVNGLVARLEDDLPGGHDNSRGDSTPAYVAKLRWLTVGVTLVAIVLAVASWMLGRWRP